MTKTIVTSRPEDLDYLIVASRSQAIRNFCVAAKIDGSIEAKNLPDDVREYRMRAALEQKARTGWR